MLPKSFRTSRHAARRMAARSINESAASVVLSYATPRRRRGADVFAMDKRARAALARDLGLKRYQAIATKLDIYFVVADHGSIITAGHRFRRLRFQ